MQLSKFIPEIKILPNSNDLIDLKNYITKNKIDIIKEIWTSKEYQNIFLNKGTIKINEENESVDWIADNTILDFRLIKKDEDGYRDIGWSQVGYFTLDLNPDIVYQINNIE